ncbi:MAG: DUF5995 family protein [Pseudomonadota bacterium]
MPSIFKNDLRTKLRSKALLVALAAFSPISPMGCKSPETASLTKESEVTPPNGLLTKCDSKMTLSQYKELLALSDISTFKDYREAAPRSERVAQIFSEAGPDPKLGKGDRRGIFASMYVEITKESVGSTSRGEYQNNEMAGKLVKRFAERYFDSLHSYLLGRPIVDEWKTYYQLAENCDTSDLRILGSGVNTHMTFDLPYALAEIESADGFENDFIKFGDILIKKKRLSTNLLKSQQNVYAASFFDLFIFGRAIDGLLSPGQAATMGFQLIRKEAWFNSRGLLKETRHAFALNSIRSAWVNRQIVLRFMPKSNPNMKGTEE